jgi:peptide/nickel transport system substrate-binding protein
MKDEQNYWKRQSRFTRRRLVLTAGMAAAAFAVACGSKSSQGGSTPSSSSGTASGATASGTPKQGGTLTVTQTTNPPTLDAQRTTSFYSLLQSSAVYSRLLRWKSGPDSSVIENHDVEPDLALSFESSDAITWTVKLRPDAKYQNIPPVNGHPVEAEDVKAAFGRGLSADSPFRASLEMMDPSQIATPDKSTVVFTLKYPYAPFQAILASANYGWIYPREAAAGAFDPAKTMIGSGPFLFDKYTPDVDLQYKRNPDFYNKSIPHIDSMRWTIVPDTSQQRAQFTGGNLDIIGSGGSTGISAFDLDAIKRDNPKALIKKGDPQAGQLLFANLGDPTSPFQDVRLRRAFSMGIDRPTIAKAVYNNDAVPQWYVPLALGKWALHQEQLPSDVAQWYKYDPANAKKMLQASGHDNDQFKLIFVTGYLGPAYEQAAQATANMLQQAGLKVQLVQVDYTKDFIGGGKGIRYGNFDKNSLVFAGLTNLSDADDYLSAYWRTNASSGLSKLSDPKLDADIAHARTLVNENERAKAYLDIQKYMADQAFGIAGFAVQYSYRVSQPRIQGYNYDLGYGTGLESWSQLWVQN